MRLYNLLNRPVDQSTPGGLTKGEGFGGGAVVVTGSRDSTPIYHHSGIKYLYPESILSPADSTTRYSLFVSSQTWMP